VKSLVAHVRGDERYARVLPPLVDLPPDQSAQLVDAFRAL